MTHHNTRTNTIVLTVMFAIAGLVFSQISFTKLAGSSLSFTLFDFFAPTAGAFLGGPVGVVAVLAVNLINFFVKGAGLEAASMVRIVTNLFAVWYFSLPSEKKTGKIILAVPLTAIALFWAHPVGREAWFFALFWLIPVAAYYRRDILFFKSLGATFTAHAVGGAAWIWAMNLPGEVWKGLVPVVAFERLSFALGIAAAYVILTYIFRYLLARKLIPSGIQFEKSKHIFS